MMLTQHISVLTHDLAKCHVAPNIEEKKRRTASLTEETGERMDRRRLADFYEVGKVIGNGGFGSVYAGTCRATGKSVAIKSTPKARVYGWSKIGKQVVPKEIALLSGLEHKFIIKMLDYFEDQEHFYIVMERPEKYIDLFDYITQKGVVSERSGRFLFRQILEAVQYCLSNGVVHRDVKDENILIDLKTNQIKLIDFGSGTFLKDGVYTEYEGTRVYCPPEWVLKHRYTALPATVWSLGILLYDMLLGDVPFEKEAEIVGGHLSFHINVSEDAENLIRWMLSFNPQDRPTMEEIINHPWMKSSSSTSSAASAPKTTSSPPRFTSSSPSSPSSPSHSSSSSLSSLTFSSYSSSSSFSSSSLPSLQSKQVAHTKAMTLPYPTRAASASSFTPPLLSRSFGSGRRAPRPPTSPSPPLGEPPRRSSPNSSRNSSGISLSGLSVAQVAGDVGRVASKGQPRSSGVGSGRKGRLQVPRK